MEGKPKTLVTFDSMKHSHSGFFHFGKSLGEHLLTENKERLDLTFYLHRKSTYHFDSRVRKEYLSVLHSLYYPSSAKYQVVHITDQYCRLKPGWIKGKVILTIHDLNDTHMNKKSPARIARKMNRISGFVERCDYVVAVSNFVAKDIVKKIPAARGKVRVIYNGADRLVVPAYHQPKVKPAQQFLFTIGHICEKKNFHTLPALLENNDLILVIAGVETAYKHKIIEAAKRYNCLERVFIVGAISDHDKSWYFQNCLAFVFPSLAEGFGLPVIEAMHFGKPVFLSTSTSLPEVGGDLAFYFQHFEPEHMRTVFNDGMKLYEEQKMKNKIIEYAGKFSWEKTANEYLDLYLTCINS